MKKRILSLIFALFMIVPCCFALTACGSEPKHTCEFANTWTKNETHHWHKCKDENCKEIADKAEHSWNDGEITTPATSSAKGVKTYTCTICKQTKTEEVDYVPTKTMTEAEWTTALSFAEITNYSASSTSSGNENFMMSVKVDGNKVYYKQIQYPEISASGADYYTEDIYVKNGTNYSYYSKRSVDGSWVDQTAGNSNSTIESMFYQVQPSGTFMMFEYNQFTYNTETGKYECASITIEGMTISNISLEFEDGRIVSGLFTMDGVVLTYLISYEPCTVTVPTINN